MKKVLWIILCLLLGMIGAVFVAAGFYVQVITVGVISILINIIYEKFKSKKS